MAHELNQPRVSVMLDGMLLSELFEWLAYFAQTQGDDDGQGDGQESEPKYCASIDEEIAALKLQTGTL